MTSPTNTTVTGVEIALANNDRVTLRVGDVFLKVDADEARGTREAAAIELAPVPTPTVLWHRPPVLALSALSGTTLDRLGEPSTASPEAWAAVGRVLRELHGAPLPPWAATGAEDPTDRLARECEWLATHGVVPAGVLERNRVLAELVLRPAPEVFIHGDLHLEHVFVEDDVVVGLIDWSEARPGDAATDLASLTVGHRERLDDLLDGYGEGADRDRVRGWWSYRCLCAVRWLTENGYGQPADLPEVTVLHEIAS